MAQNTYTVTVKYDTGGDHTFPKVVSPNGEVVGTATVYLVGAGGAGGSGSSSNYGAGGGGGGASTTATGYDVVNYTLPFHVAIGDAYSGSRSWVGASSEVYANGGGTPSSVSSNNSTSNGASGGSAITGLPKAVTSSYGSDVKITKSFAGGSGGNGYRNVLSVETAGGGGSGAGKLVSGATGSAGGALDGGSGASSRGDGLSGSGGRGSGNAVINASSGATGGGGGGGRTSGNNAAAGNGGNGRVMIEFVYQWNGQMPIKPILNDLNSRCIITETLSIPLSITNPEISPVVYRWCRSNDPIPSEDDICLTTETSYTVTSPGYYYVYARILDDAAPNFNATSIAPYCDSSLGSPAVYSDVVWFGTEPQIDNVITAQPNCGTPAISLTGIKPSGTTYTWSAPTNASLVHGTTTGNRATSFSAGSLVNGSTSPVDLVYTVTPIDSVFGVKCVGTDFTVTITVDPAVELSYTEPATPYFIPPLASPDNTITLNLRDYVDSYEGILAFYRNNTVQYYDSISNSNQLVLSPCDTIIYVRAFTSSTCITDPRPIHITVLESVQGKVHWDSENKVYYACSVVDLTKIIDNVYPLNTTVEF
ncbi:hypothetical protein FACS189413_18960 [Bacteroidia bacterium]|nr:hypothetical protein FACS189413_18960 [Bacteroidia bacterium]